MLNRAAAAEPSGELGQVLSEGGRETVQPLFAEIMQPLAQEHGQNAAQLTGWFLGLRVGDMQIKRVIEVMPELTETELNARVQGALQAFGKLLKDES
ncbi:hypothetical protein KO498_13120 [Lentibacter algarum]|uniref:hypothetical protein n=1 Tax=Lentibacter algarum TaxID=576131 RepID=UPI001C0A3ED2|nr:hypothetical protein [Lentibacter algarum]MBU2982751.1 hypothetical protein [Lentibacter algarum]